MLRAGLTTVGHSATRRCVQPHLCNALLGAVSRGIALARTVHMCRANARRHTHAVRARIAVLRANAICDSRHEQRHVTRAIFRAKRLDVTSTGEINFRRAGRNARP